MAKLTFTDFGQASSAAFMGDFGDREHILAGGAQLDSTAAFPGTEGNYTITVNDAAAAAGDTALGVVALPVSIPAGTTLDFGGEFATIATTAAAAATSLVVEPLGEAIADASTATYDSLVDTNVVPAGTLVGRTNAQRLAGDPFGPAADADDEVYIMVHDVDLKNANEDDRVDIELVRHGSLIKYNFLPSWAGSSSGLKTKLYAAYQIIKG